MEAAKGVGIMVAPSPRCAQIQRLLQVIHQARVAVANMNYSPVANGSDEGFFSWLGLGDLTSGSQGSSGYHLLQDDVGPVDTSKLSKYLEYTVDYLCKVFQVRRDREQRLKQRLGPTWQQLITRVKRPFSMQDRQRFMTKWIWEFPDWLEATEQYFVWLIT